MVQVRLQQPTPYPTLTEQVKVYKQRAVQAMRQEPKDIRPQLLEDIYEREEKDCEA